MVCSSHAERDGQNYTVGAEHRLSSGISLGCFLGPSAHYSVLGNTEHTCARQPALLVCKAASALARNQFCFSNTSVLNMFP